MSFGVVAGYLLLRGRVLQHGDLAEEWESLLLLAVAREEFCHQACCVLAVVGWSLLRGQEY